jgi:Zn-dependent protease/CBS domain-containing protein
MGWSLRIARVAGTEIRIHVTFLLFLAWIGFAYYQEYGAAAAAEGVLFITLLFACVALHELGHATAARAFGIPTPDITLLPIGGVARLQRMPDKPLQEIVVALAGPAVNVLIALVLVVGAGASIGLSHLQHVAGRPGDLLDRLATVNVGLVVFNLIPAFPMDGGRVLRALVATQTSYGRATRIAAGIGQAFAFLFGFVGLFGNPMLIFIALFLYLGASQEAAVAGLKDLAGWMTVSDAMVTEVMPLDLEATIGEAVEALLRTSQHEFPVVDAAGRVYGILTRDDMIRGLRDGGPELPVAAVMRRDIPRVDEDASFDEAFQLMQECQCPALPVVNRWGRLVGLITPENVGELMRVRSVLPRGAALPWRRQLR